jgi:hypothetical protein
MYSSNLLILVTETLIYYLRDVYDYDLHEVR